MKSVIHIIAIFMLIVAFLSSFISIRIYSFVKYKVEDRPRGRGRMDDDEESGNPDVKISAIISAIISIIITVSSVMLIISKFS